MSPPANRLAHENSPYLLQHAHNPVDWYAWGEEAFAKARAEDKPIFLSIGYSTCHWCHVMERESFENAAVAAVLNERFVAVKLDREERPDVDRVYMTAMQMMGLGGGWPLNVFLTPSLEPFYGGTYFPPQSTHGRIGMLDLLPRVDEAWRMQREQVLEQGARVIESLKAMAAREGDSNAAGVRSLARGGSEPAERYNEPAERHNVFAERDREPAERYNELSERCFDALARGEDSELGGFGTEPKFPQPSNLTFLFRWWVRDPLVRGESLAMALRQLDAMRAGGIHDALGGGFHRYSTDRQWHVPHFEKMLYDQAQLAWSYLAAWQWTGREEYAQTARGIFDYVRRDLTSPEGAFYSAEDADSEGEEGRFYVWTPAEIDALLPAGDAALFRAHYGVTPGGNFEHGASILHASCPLADAARDLGMPLEDAAARLERSRTTLLAARAQRVRPHLDDKVLTAWNGLMISAFARGARALDDPALAAAAARAGEFVWTRLFAANGRTAADTSGAAGAAPDANAAGGLSRRWRNGEAAAPGQLDDYAYAAYGFLDLYRATFDVTWLERAATLTEAMIVRFADGERGGFFESPAGDPHVRVRMKSDFDGAENSGVSIAALVLLALGRLFARRDWLGHVERTLALYAARLEHGPLAMPQMLVAMDVSTEVTRHIVVTGAREAPDTRALLREFDSRHSPEDLLLLVNDEATRRRLAALAPFTASLEFRDGRAAALVCVDYTCHLPTHDPLAFAARLDEFAPARPNTGVSA